MVRREVRRHVEDRGRQRSIEASDRAPGPPDAPISPITPLDTGIRPESNASSGEPVEVPDDEVIAHLGNPGSILPMPSQFLKRTPVAVFLLLTLSFCFSSSADNAAEAKKEVEAPAAFGASLTSSVPDGAVVVPASSGALAAMIDSHGAGTTFFLEAGVHTVNGVMRPKAGSVFVGEAGAILDGGNDTTHCFVHDAGLLADSDRSPRYVVTLRNLVIRNYASADQECAVNIPDTGQGWSKVLTDAGDRTGWLLDHCTFTSNRAGGRVTAL